MAPIILRIGAKTVGQHERTPALLKLIGRSAHVLAHEPAIARLAESRGQLDHLEIVSAADGVLLHPRIGFAAGAIVVGVEAIVRQGQVDRSVQVLQAGGQHAVVPGGGEVAVVVQRVVRAERITDAELETLQAGRLVQHHVVQAHGVGGAECRAHVRRVVAHRERVDRAEELRRQVGLAAEFQAAPRIAVQAHRGLAAEQAAALQRVAVERAEAGLQVEHGAQAVAQVFAAAQAEARAALTPCTVPMRLCDWPLNLTCS